ncbi:uncharacterized protein ACWYII_034158, partial [Salvelinus alpinus]
TLQYKKRCGELEEQLLEKTSESERLQLSLQAQLDSSAHRRHRTETQLQDNSRTIQSKLAMLEEEQKRCAGLSQVNALLREQLEQASSANQSLTESLRRASEDLEQKDVRLRKEQETCAYRVGREQARVRALWRQAASLRSTFTQLRTFADRSLSDIRGECVTASRSLHAACMSLEARVTPHIAPSGLEVSELERQLRDKLREAMQLQGRWDAEKVELNSRILELTDMVKHLRAQNSEKDTGLAAMQTSLDRMETSRAEDRAEMDDFLSEINILQKVLTSITQLVHGGEDGKVSGGQPSSSSSSPLRGRTPQCNNTLMAVKGLLSQHQIQTQDLRSRLDAALEQVDILHRNLQEQEEERRDLEGRMKEVQKENQQVERSLEEKHRDNQRFHTSLDLLNSEKVSLEKLVVGLQQKTESLGAELEVMRGSAGDLQRQRDLLRQQRDDLERQLERQRSEAQRGERSLEQLDGKNSDLRRELVTVREALSQVTLQKEVLDDEKNSLTLALSKMESQSAGQELSVTKLQSQEASLRDSLAKMAALSEGLANDKVELNRILLQIEGEKAELGERRREAEVERASAREETGRLQQDLQDLTADRRTLESSYSLLQETNQRLEAELALLQRENNQILEQHVQVNKQVQSLSDQLTSSRRELDSKAVALQRAHRDREDVAKDKASLGVQLTAVDRRAWVLEQELAILRAEKESLETCVFEGQELVSSLEGERNRLEVERSTLTMADEDLTREVARLKAEVDLQVSRAGQEREVLETKLAQTGRNHQIALSTEEHSHRERLEQEHIEKEQQCVDLTLQRERAEAQLRSHCEQQRLQSQAELQQLQEEMDRLQQVCNNSLLQAESTKQQALSQKEGEKAALTERLTGLQQDLETAGLEMERGRRDALSLHQQDKDTIAGLQCELQSLRSRFEESLSSHESSEKSLTEQVRELNQQRETARHEKG